MHRQLRSGTHTQFERELIKNTPRTYDESMRDGKHKFDEFGNELLGAGREALIKHAYEEAMTGVCCLGFHVNDIKDFPARRRRVHGKFIASVRIDDVLFDSVDSIV
jgi:hypothetical protein